MADHWCWTRRRFLAAVGAASITPCGCSGGSILETGGGSARLSSRPGIPTGTITPGTYPLGLGPESYDGFLHVPASYVAGAAMPLVLGLHGAGTRASAPLDFLRPYAESHGFLLLTVDSVGVTWDAITFKYLSDVVFIDRALAHAFARCSVDPARVVVEGFSDGATYALGLGLANGDLFRRVVAFSPGGIITSDDPYTGTPEFFLSHGRQDPILPIQDASRKIVEQLRDDDYVVQYTEFDGGHEVPAAVVQAASAWMVR